MKKTTLLAIVYVSLLALPSWAQSSAFQPHPSCSNSNCSAVCDAARAQVERDVQTAINRAVEITGRVSNAQSCSQQIISQVNRQIPSFGGNAGGLIDTITSQFLTRAANEACSVMGRLPNVQSVVNASAGAINGIGGRVAGAAGTAVNDAVGGAAGRVVGDVVTNQVGSVISAPVENPLTLTQRLRNLF